MAKPLIARHRRQNYAGLEIALASRPSVSPLTDPFDRRGSNVRDQNPLGSIDRRRLDRAGIRLGRHAVDCVAARLSAAAWPPMVRGLARLAGLPAASLLLVVVWLRCLRAARLYRGSVDRLFGRVRLDRGGDCHVGLARPRSAQRDDLRLGTVRDRAGGARGRHARRGRRDPWPARKALPAPRRARAHPVFRAYAEWQGRGLGRADAAHLVRKRGRARHQGRELDVDRGVAGAVRPGLAVRPDQP